MRFTFICTLLVLSGCSFNRLFLYPTPLDRSEKTTQVFDYESNQMMRVVYGDSLQPNFFDVKGNEMDFLYDVKSVFFQSERGRSLHGWYITPKNIKVKASIFYLHGNAGNIYSQYSIMLPLVLKGYGIFMFDYSGFGYSEGKATRKHVLEDAEAAFVYFLNEKEWEKDSEVKIVYGQSLGGHLAASLSNRWANEIDGLVIEGAFSSHEAIAAEFSGLGGFARMMTRQMYSGIDTIAISPVPKLVIHSTEDATIPYAMGVELYEKARGPKTFYSIDQKHILGPLYYTDSINNGIQKLYSTGLQ